jgi:hypothetical protein
VRFAPKRYRVNLVLAYVFSHRPAAGVEVAVYESALKHFHATLGNTSLSGFLGSAAFRVGDHYRDWYLIESSAALDALNEAAISGARALAHDAVARMAIDGIGKLWSLVTGPSPSGSGYEMGFSKPIGTEYTDLYIRIQPFIDRAGVSLWRRMMVLGPPPEFCLITPEEIQLPKDLNPEVLRQVAL